MILALVAVLAIGLGVGLGVGLSRDSSPSSPQNTANTSYSIGGAIDPEYFSKEGAFNGSGIALASQSFAKDLQDGTQGSLVMYFQHWTGAIRYKQLSSNGDWLGGDYSETVAVGAKNGTPLSAVSYVLDEASTWHVFCESPQLLWLTASSTAAILHSSDTTNTIPDIDVNNTIRQRSNSNKTNVWVDGPINDLNIKAYDADRVGMQACWYGSDYGDTDYTHTPLPDEDKNTTTTSREEYGMHMWYASDATTFQQLGWREGDTGWAHQQEWRNKNGHAGVGCYSWGPGTVTYVMFVNLDNSVEFYWKDTNTNTTSTSNHPINTWTNCESLAFPPSFNPN
jgi:hypothetical protein